MMVKPFGKKVVPMAVIVEGPMDALAAAGEGYYGFALMGNTPPPEVLNHVIALCTARGIVGAVVVPDHDSSESGPHLAAYSYDVGDPRNRQEVGLGAEVFLRVDRPRVRAEVSCFASSCGYATPWPSRTRAGSCIAT